MKPVTVTTKKKQPTRAKPTKSTNAKSTTTNAAVTTTKSRNPSNKSSHTRPGSETESVFTKSASETKSLSTKSALKTGSLSTKSASGTRSLSSSGSGTTLASRTFSTVTSSASSTTSEPDACPVRFSTGKAGVKRMPSNSDPDASLHVTSITKPTPFTQPLPGHVTAELGSKPATTTTPLFKTTSRRNGISSHAVTAKNATTALQQMTGRSNTPKTNGETTCRKT
ncbi:hypothetical protein K469DRAFT_348527 [Zopfia rhizophila CBS 207.26]|uniref:Uncharacterized protein n=1 Tax=Zopfia rhizophila CBS 207.26 TaxID=1314779 RepID=A0A6A6DF65_9PEZI|nr:hypothetical protein K469DRAFT_348527 [Zopfia rhizophila CBS 207.26]